MCVCSRGHRHALLSLFSESRTLLSIIVNTKYTILLLILLINNNLKLCRKRPILFQQDVSSQFEDSTSKYKCHNEILYL